MDGSDRGHAAPLSAAALAALLLGGTLVAAVTVAAQGAARPPAAAIEPGPPRGAVRARVEPLPLRTVTIAATGDIALAATPDGGASLFGGVGRALRADVSLGNLEGTFATSGVSKCGAQTASGGCYAFRAPPAYAFRLARAGFTVLNLANNHANDFGPSGLAETVTALRRSRLRVTGRPGEITVEKAGGVRVAVLGFAPYPWAQSLLDVAAAARLVRRAATRADLVVVTMHAGAEGSDRTHVAPGDEWYLGERRGNVVAFAHAVVRAGADLVVGHGPHVLRGLEWYRGRLIAYSLGNFAAYRTLDVSGVLGVSGILRATLREDGSWESGRLVPVRLVGAGTPTLDRARTASAQVRGLSRRDFGRRAAALKRSGEIVRPRG